MPREAFPESTVTRPRSTRQALDDLGERRPVEHVERRPYVADLQLGVPLEPVPRRRLADALDRGPQLARQVVLDRGLQRGEALVAELAGQADHRRRPGPCRLGELGDRPEGDELGALQDHLGDTPLGPGEGATRTGDPLLRFHGRGA